jgi:hypothetical protein
MSKVEELHHQILDRIGKFAHGELQGYVSWLIIDDLISAAHAEGVVEERERIRKAGVPVSNVTFSPNGKVMQLESDGGDHMPSYFVPASALAPKESEK